MRKNNFALKLIALLFLLSIFIPVLSLLPWMFTQRWEWPEIIPSALSLRGLMSILAKEKNLLKLTLSSVWLSTVVSVLSVAIGILSARALVQRGRFTKIFYLLVLLPFVIPSTVFGMGSQLMMIKLGLGRSFWGVVLVHLIYSLPYATKLLYDGTQSFGMDLEEQSRVLGASAWQSFWRVSMPNLAPVILSALSMSFIISFSQYFLTLIIGGGKIRTFTVVMVPYLHGGERSISAVYSLVFLGICVTVFALFEWAIAKMMRSRGHEA